MQSFSFKQLLVGVVKRAHCWLGMSF